MKYTGDIKENSIVILFSVITIYWLYKSSKNCDKKNDSKPKWILIFDNVKIYIFLLSLCLYSLNCFSFNYNIMSSNNVGLNFGKKYKMKVYTEPPIF